MRISFTFTCIKWDDCRLLPVFWYVLLLLNICNNSDVIYPRILDRGCAPDAFPQARTSGDATGCISLYVGLLLSSLWVSRTGSASGWCKLQEALYKCIDTIQYNISAAGS